MVFFEVAGAVAKIGLTLKANHHNQVKLVQIPDTQTVVSKTNPRKVHNGFWLTGKKLCAKIGLELVKLFYTYTTNVT